MLIILEGPDCAGKSTLARELVDMIGRLHPEDHVSLMHTGPPSEHALIAYAAPLLNYRPGSGRHIICDRWHIGEFVYPPIVDRPTTMDDQVAAWLDMFLQSRGALLIHCDADVEYLSNCARKRGDEESFIAQIPETNMAFTRAITRSTLRRVSVVAHNVNTAGLAAAIYADALAIDRCTAPLNGYITYVGPPRPTTLLLGDRRGVDGLPSDHGLWPAFAPKPATSGHYLMRTLTSRALSVPRDGFTLGTIGVANAVDVDDPMELWRTLGCPKVVALGLRSRGVVDDSKIAYTFANHPQYRRRFHFKEVETYLRQLTRGGRYAT